MPPPRRCNRCAGIAAERQRDQYAAQMDNLEGEVAKLQRECQHKAESLQILQERVTLRTQAERRALSSLVQVSLAARQSVPRDGCGAAWATGCRGHTRASRRPGRGAAGAGTTPAGGQVR